MTSSFVQVADREYHALVKLRARPFSLQDLDEADRSAAERSLAKGLILYERDAFRMHRYDHFDIEINTHCNFRCVYCPVGKHPLPRKVMSPDLFETVLSRVCEYGAASIALNHYGEPTLSPHLVQCVRLAKECDLRVHLFTNASHLSEDVTRQLADLGNVSLLVNLPSADPEEFSRLTRSNEHARVLDNVRSAVRLGLPVWLAVNTASNTTSWQRRRLRRKLIEATSAEVFLARVIPRAGALSDARYAIAPRHTGRLGGCLSFLQKLSINVDGRVFLCCNDYRQEYVVGDLRQSKLEDIVTSKRAVQLRRWIFGDEEPPEDLICRRCEETRAGDGRLCVGHLDGMVLGDSFFAKVKASLQFRRLSRRFAVRLDEQTIAEPSSAPAFLSIAGTRFR